MVANTTTMDLQIPNYSLQILIVDAVDFLHNV
jgi:hypothetical protein